MLIHSLVLACKRGEQGGSHLRDGKLEGHGQTVVQLLRAHNTILLGEHDEAAQARPRWVSLVIIWQEFLAIDNDGAGDIVLSLKGDDLGEHSGLVLGNSIINDRVEEVLVTLTAAKSDLGLNELDQALDEQVLKELLMGSWVVLELLMHLSASLSLETLNQLVGALHTINTRFVLGLRPLDLHVALSNLQVFGGLVLQTLLLGLDHVLRLSGEVILHLLLNGLDALPTLSANEVGHAINDGLGLHVVHL